MRFLSRMPMLLFVHVLVFMASASSVCWGKSLPVKKTPVVKSELKILSSRGSILDKSLSKTSAWTMKSRFADRLRLKLDSGAETKIQLHRGLILTAYSQSEFEIPQISWETREFKEIKLINGSVRLEVSEEFFKFSLTTLFFELQPPKGTWVFNMDPERAFTDVLSLEGDLELRALNAEESVRIKSGEKVTFRGILEEGEVAYDLLLEGRKVPKGRWLTPEPLSKADLISYSLENEKKRLQLEYKKKEQAAREELKKQSGQVCVKPKGDFGDCLWTKRGSDCVRTRCTADGQWKDAQVVPLSFCEKGAGSVGVSRACDY